jgi:hypothetical protein
MDEDVDILSTPQIQPCTSYPPKGTAWKMTEEPSTAGVADPEELEARKVRGKRVAEMIQKHIAMAGEAPKERLAGLVDVVDESEDLCYIDDDATLVIRDSEVPTLQPQSNLEDTVMNPSESLGLKAQNPIDLDARELGSPRHTRLVLHRRCRMTLTSLLRKLPRRPHCAGDDVQRFPT